ncbi:type II secretion system minor pseudopilin GspJ [Marinobacter caseinilyticus]|uniref:type II secretion system minor pseudopilin GspJ n=1 Tax=Marinobacter caseinilyticus TaxID=2692195 RepID=UPI0014078F97|nr:type II secretion system minor pseudopilin GspJ [Marinobacter caseinilyticus]
MRAPIAARHWRREQGFTLMEVLIAVTITAVIGLGVWQVIGGVVLSRDRVDDVSEDFEALQKAFLLIGRDMTQIVNRPVRNIYGDFEPALSSRDDAFELVLTRQGWRNPLGRRRSELQRSAYEFTGEELRRRYWVAVDQAQEDESRDQLLLKDISEFNVRFMDKERTWVDDWPPGNSGDGSGESSGNGQKSPQLPMPLGIEISLSHDRFGEITRLFTLPDFDRSEAQGAISRSIQSQLSEEDDTQPEQPPVQGAN